MATPETMAGRTGQEEETLEARVAALERRLEEMEEALPEDRVSLVVFSGDLDRVIAAFIIATGAAALGQQVSMFFTFWGYNAIREKRVLEGKGFLEKLMALMSPSGSRGLPLSRMNYFGAGSRMLRAMMKRKDVASLEDLMATAREMGVTMIACDMSRDLMGIRDDELIDGLEPGGVGSFLADGLDSRITLVI